MSARDLERLAKAIRDRRGELGVSQEEFVARAGTSDSGRVNLSVKQLSRIENAEVNPRSKTLGMIDRAADWEPGSARQTLEGKDPKPRRQPATGADRPRLDPWGAEVNRVLVAVRSVLELQGVRMTPAMLQAWHDEILPQLIARQVESTTTDGDYSP